MPTGRQLGELALEWAKQGVPVFPCSARKTPLTKNGHHDGVTDADEVLRLFERAGEAAVYIGATMGRKARLFAIDCDTYKPGAAGESAKQFEEYLRRSGLLEETRTHKTVSGGVHYIFYSDTDWPNCKPVAGVEVKGEGGYIIVPPSPGYEIVTKGLATASPALIAELNKAKADASNATISDLKRQIMSGEAFHGPLTVIAARKANEGWSAERIQNELLNIMQASVARMPDHERHPRWKALITDMQGELGRIVGSAEKKYNSNSAADALREAAAIAGKIFNANAPRNHEAPKAKEPEEYNGEWPFAGGYFFGEETDILEQKYVAYPILAEHETTVIFADPKAGKTLLTHTLAMHIASGKPIGDKIWIAEPRPVLYFALEGQVAVKRRQVAWQTLHPKVQQLPLYVHERPVNLADENVRTDFVNKVLAAEAYFAQRDMASIGAIVIDTLTKAMPGKDQNSVEDTSAVFDIIGRLRAAGIAAAIIFVHHKNRANTGPRGSGNIMAEPDTLLQLEKTEAGQIKLSVSMARSIDDDFGELYFNINSVNLGKTEQGFEIKAPVLEYTIHREQAKTVSKGPAQQATENLQEAKRESILLAALAELEEGTYTIAELHTHMLSKALPRNLYPSKMIRSKAKQIQKVYQDLIPTGGRIFGHMAFMPEIEKGMVVRLKIFPIR